MTLLPKGLNVLAYNHFLYARSRELKKKKLMYRPSHWGYSVPSRRVHQVRKSNAGQLAPRIGLIQEGPCVRVLIGLAQSFLSQLSKDRQSVPSSVPGMALIDTGASTTCIDDLLAQSLGLPVIDVAKIVSASHADTEVSVYPIQIEIVGLGKVDVPSAFAPVSLDVVPPRSGGTTRRWRGPSRSARR